MRTVFVMAAVLAAAQGSHGFDVPGFAVAGRLDRTAAMPAPSVGDRATAHAVGSAGVAAAAHNARASNHRRARMARMARIPQFSMHAAAPATSIAGLAAFLDASPTPYQMVAAAAEKLRGEGFVELKEDSRWAEEGMLQQGGKYFYTREGTTLVAFTVGGKFEPGNGFKVVGAHTDSPVLKVKPVSKLKGSGYMQLGVECYGGGLWHTWLDRDLSLAGMLVVGTPDGGFERKLVRVSRPLLRVPSLCIHLQTPAEREKLEVNKEMHLRPILARLTQEVNNKPSGDSTKGGLVDRHHPVLLDVVAEAAGCAVEDIRDFDLSLYDTQPGQVWGANQEFYSGARIDNQVHCFTGLEALTSHAAARLDEDTDVSVLVVFDHEEVGSSSTHGAGSPIIKEVVERVNESFGLFGTGARGGGEAYKRSLRQSFVLSADVAHGIHPNYAGKHEQNHGPMLNQGTVIKSNSNQRYATSATTGFVVRELSRMADLEAPQEFVVRNDCPCGSTIGPAIAALTGIRTVDIGIACWSMHSIRETCGVQDVDNSIKLFTAFYQHFRALDSACDF